MYFSIPLFFYFRAIYINLAGIFRVLIINGLHEIIFMYIVMTFFTYRDAVGFIIS